MTFKRGMKIKLRYIIDQVHVVTKMTDIGVYMLYVKYDADTALHHLPRGWCYETYVTRPELRQ